MHDRTYRLEGNVVDVSKIGSNVIVSVDTVYKPCSTTKVREAAIDGNVLLQTLKADWSPVESENGHVDHLKELTTQVNKQGSFDLPPGGEKGIKELLYNIESLRKRGEE